MPTPADLARVRYLDAAYAKNPLLWISQCVRTFDEHDAKTPIKPFPIDKPYLARSAQVWLETPLLFIEKSRQLMYSWLLIILHLWLAQFTAHRRVFFQSKREDDAKSMLERAWFVWESQPDWLRAKHPATRTATKIHFENGSEIWGIPHGPNVLRQYTSSAVLSDEQAFQEDAEDSWGAAMPTITGGGRFTGVSTANPGFFASAVEKCKKAAHLPQELLLGLKVWKATTDDAFSVLRAHYTADPDPRTVRKVAQARAAYETAGRHAFFQKEYEIDYGALSGQLIWPELSKDLHIIQHSVLTADPCWADWDRFRVIDPGWRNPCGVLWVAVSPPGWRGCVAGTTPIPVLVVYREFYQANRTVDQIAAHIKARSGSERYRISLIDPSSDIHKGNESAGRSTFEQFQQLGIPCVKADNTVEAGLDEVRRRLEVYGQSPALLFTDQVPNTWNEIAKYRYQEMGQKALESRNPSEKPRKLDDHLADCLRYGCSWLPVKLPNSPKSTPAPRGSFGAAMKKVIDIRRMRGSLGNALWRLQNR